MEKIKQKKSLCRIKDIAKRLSIGESTAWRYVNKGELPPPHAKLSKCCTVWLESDIDQYIDDKSLQQTEDRNSEVSEVSNG